MGQSYVYINTNMEELCKLFSQSLGWIDPTKVLQGGDTFKPGDGHITLLYGANPERLKEILRVVREKFDNSNLDSRFIRITGVEISFDKKSIICMLDSPLLDELFQTLYGNPEFCTGHPDHAGHMKFEDGIHMKRRPHFTLVTLHGEPFETVPPGLSEFATNFPVFLRSIGLNNRETNEDTIHKFSPRDFVPNKKNKK